MTKVATAILAGGCFWGMEELFRKQTGVLETEVGYTGGTNDHPTYEYHPGHAEALKITFDPEQTSFETILDFFFQIHNPTTLNRQGYDFGTAYRSAIFYKDEAEKDTAKRMIAIVNKSGRWRKKVVTTLEPLATFWLAENYHQDYLLKHPRGYTCHKIYFDSYLDANSSYEPRKRSLWARFLSRV